MCGENKIPNWQQPYRRGIYDRDFSNERSCQYCTAMARSHTC